ncbi:MAG: DNA mismatch repair endonuclease MutL [Sandaracinaceae bacterium]
MVASQPSPPMYLDAAPRPVRVLPDALVDQIAAGEVVERPASVVKELVENALDAGATAVRVETEQGGIARIVVSDDGHGMGPDDARLALARHATSKITGFDDLLAIRTLGFRGEALPSIASVSRFSLRTRLHDAIEGVEVRVEGGEGMEVRPVGGSPGTTVRVDDLFFNVPARRKFLKSLATESGQIGETLTRLALARPALRLLWLRDGRRAREWAPARDTFERARQLFPDEKLAALEGERDGVRVRAVLSAPERARAGAGLLYVSINGRGVRDRTLARAVAFAYGSTLAPGRYPLGAVWVEIDPTRLDVNVHPQKAEVRFADARAVLDAITRVLAAGLGSAPFQRRRVEAKPATALWPEPQPEVHPEVEPDPWGLGGSPYAPSPSTPSAVHDAEESFARTPPAAAVSPSARAFSGLRVLGQLARTYLVCEGETGLVVLDQHAADERVRYARLRAAHRDGAIEIQRLLVPERVPLSDREVATLLEHETLLAGMGLEVRLLGERVALVAGVPALLPRAAPERLLRDALAELSRCGSRAFGDAIDTALATMACHAAIRAGDVLAPDEQRALVANLAAVSEHAGHCPHGRPIVHEIPLEELARKVGR